MTQQERLVVSAYTGYLMTDFRLVHGFIEERLGRPIWTHEFAGENLWEEIREKLKPDFLALCGRPAGEPPAPPGTVQPFNSSTFQP